VVANPRVELVDVDEHILELLVEAATTDAAADDVTPPVTDGPQWTAARVAWLRQFHRAHRDGGTGQSVWAVLVDGAVVGQVRLQRRDADGAGEIGMWLARGVRGRGVGTSLERAGFTVVPGGARGLQARLDLLPEP
jgi:RimJ/RimL family protein N-acetyltransferase